MLTYLLSILIFLIFFGDLALHSKKESSTSFFSKDFTTILKALACLVVIYVHIPEPYHNAIQRMILSFGYVGVSCFFMISAYGMQLSIEKNPQYLKSFWRNRLASLLIPTFLVNCLCTVVECNLLQTNFSIASLIYVCGYVKVLLAYCLWFFLIELLRKRIQTKYICDFLLVFGIVASSLFDYFTHLGVANSAIANWPYERVGLVWGFLLYRKRIEIQRFISQRQIVKISISLLASLVLGICYLKFKHELFWGEYLLKVFLGFAIISFTICISYGISLRGRICSYIGKISFEIYLVHELIMRSLSYFWKDAPSGTFIIITIVIAIATASLLHWIAVPLIKKCRH